MKRWDLTIANKIKTSTYETTVSQSNKLQQRTSEGEESLEKKRTKKNKKQEEMPDLQDDEGYMSERTSHKRWSRNQNHITTIPIRKLNSPSVLPIGREEKKEDIC